MQVSAGSGQLPTGPDWVVELAWTGHRCIAYVEPGRRTRLLSAKDVSMTAAYPELAAPLERRSPPRGMILDGTVVARGEEHAPRARLLARRSARFHPSEQHIRNVPVDLQVADLLWLDGHSTVDLPYRERRALLEGLGFDSAPVWTTSPMPVSELAGMVKIADAKGVDALHARHLGSRYRPGGRSPLWFKVPVPRARHVVVGGWTPTDPAHPDTIASLLLGVPADDGGLRYVGRVGVSGEDRREVTELRKLRIRRSPFPSGSPGAVPADHARHAIWVQPRMVGLVEFIGFVTGGRLRLPLWRGPVDLPDAEDPQWARPAVPPPRRSPEQLVAMPSRPDQPTTDQPTTAQPTAAQPTAARPTTAQPTTGEPPPGRPDPQAPTGVEQPTEPAPPVEDRRLEQHFVYNSLNTIAALIRTDPGRARELLFGFADLSRATDQPSGVTTLGRELEAVHGYLQLEQARFGKRLRVELDVAAALHSTPVAPLRVLAAVRAAVQQRIEPRPEGGVLALTAARRADGECIVSITAGDGEPTVLTLQPVAAVHGP